MYNCGRRQPAPSSSVGGRPASSFYGIQRQQDAGAYDLAQASLPAFPGRIESGVTGRQPEFRAGRPSDGSRSRTPNFTPAMTAWRASPDPCIIRRDVRAPGMLVAVSAVFV
jgi:hypothetical protein